MAYFTTVVTSGGPEWALGGLVVLLSTSVTITVQDLPCPLEETLPMFLKCGISSAARLGLCSLRAFSAAVSIVCAISTAR